MVCKIESCGLPAVGKSKYYQEHKIEARKRWLSMVREKSEGRTSRLVAFRDLWEKADRAGKVAADACVPVPMHVVQHENPFDDFSPIVKKYLPVMGGVCGFAWIKITPGTCSFAHYAKKHLGASKDYYGGLSIWIGAYNQSYERKMAYARATAETLRSGLSEMGERGSVSAGGRLD